MFIKNQYYYFNDNILFFDKISSLLFVIFFILTIGDKTPISLKDVGVFFNTLF